VQAAKADVVGKQSTCCTLFQSVPGKSLWGDGRRCGKTQQAPTREGGHEYSPGTHSTRQDIGGSGSGMRVGRGVHMAARFLIWSRQQVMREQQEVGVGGKRTRSGGRRGEGETVPFITSSGS
jgi:hypothetical protein